VATYLGPGYRQITMSDVTSLLQRIDSGDPAAAESLLPLVYDELRRLAAAQMSRESPDQTLQPTALVHEAYLRLVGSDGAQNCWNSKGHFFGAAAIAMRRILVEAARRRGRVKRGGELSRQALDEANLAEPENSDRLLLLDAAMTRLAAERPEIARLVELRYFAGLTMPQAAEALGIPLRTAERSWTYARAWLQAEIAGE